MIAFRQIFFRVYSDREILVLSIIDQIVLHGTDPAVVTIDRLFELANRTKLIGNFDSQNPVLSVVF